MNPSHDITLTTQSSEGPYVPYYGPRAHDNDHLLAYLPTLFP